jgi:hypothetical protein
MYEAVVIIGILVIVVILLRSHLIYDKTHPLSRKERNSEPYHYKSYKQGTTRAEDCGKPSKKP